MTNSEMKDIEAVRLTEYRATRLTAASFALTALSVVLVSGLFAGASATRTILIGLAAMGVCYLVGEVMARIGLTAVSQAVESHKASNPIPSSIEEPASEDNADILEVHPYEGGADGATVVDSSEIARAA
ncbi:MAG: hypothetical protein AAF108_02350 [Planctomycetota bacterium]